MKTLRLSFVGMKLRHLPLALAALGSLLPVVNPAFAQTWTQTSAPNNSWHAVAMSADGTKLVAVASAGPIFFSTNSGDTWMPAVAPAQDWYSVAYSADGTRLVATASFSTVYTSADSGATWLTATNAPYTTYWSSVASSADGSRVVVGSYDSVHRYGGLTASADSGATWTSLTNAPAAVTIASSADGTKLIAGSGYCCGPASPAGSFATSTNSGATWTDTRVGSGFWNAVASSANGDRLVGVNYGDNGLIYTSADSGATWTATSAPGGNWISVAASADGMKLVAAQGGGLYIPGPGYGGPVYTSIDSGASWTSNNVPDAFSVAASADGSKLVAVVNGGGIYISQSTPRPYLSITRSTSNLVLSWTVPSMDFVLQKNSDLTSTNWTDVTNAPTLNLTNLQNQVTVQAPTGSRFYRLKH